MAIPDDRCCAVVELRQYTLRPSRRDDLIELFDREFVETQEATGMHLVAQFRDLDDPDRFVWIRGFTDMSSRMAALTAFYGGPVWKQHSAAAVSTMIDSDDVLLLKPAFENAGLDHPPAPRPSITETSPPASTVVVTVHSVAEPLLTAQVRDFAAEADGIFAAHGARSLAWYETEPAENTYPALPVRTDVSVLVNVAAFDGEAHYLAIAAQLADHARAAGGPLLLSATSHLRLAPTARSQLR